VVRKWEYFSGPIHDDSDMMLVGQDGWELVIVVMVSVLDGHDAVGNQIFNDVPHGYFKRPVGQDETSKRILAIANKVGA